MNKILSYLEWIHIICIERDNDADAIKDIEKLSMKAINLLDEKDSN